MVVRFLIGVIRRLHEGQLCIPVIVFRFIDKVEIGSVMGYEDMPPELSHIYRTIFTPMVLNAA